MADILATIAAATSATTPRAERVRTLSNLIRTKAMITKIQTGTTLYRTLRFHAERGAGKPVMGLPTSIERLGAPPPEYASPGRANTAGQSRFYCCSDQAGAAQENRITVYDHYSPMPEDLVIATTWTVLAPLYLFTLGYSELAFQAASSTRRPSVDQQRHYANLTKEERCIQEHLDLAFASRIEIARPDCTDVYTVQNTIANAIFEVWSNQSHGIMYPSARHRDRGVDNIVLRPEPAEKLLYLDSAFAGVIASLTTDGAIYLKRAELVSSADGLLSWVHWN